MWIGTEACLGFTRGVKPLSRHKFLILILTGLLTQRLDLPSIGHGRAKKVRRGFQSTRKFLSGSSSGPSHRNAQCIPHFTPPRYHAASYRSLSLSELSNCIRSIALPYCLASDTSFRTHLRSVQCWLMVSTARLRAGICSLV